MSVDVWIKCFCFVLTSEDLISFVFVMKKKLFIMLETIIVLAHYLKFYGVTAHIESDNGSTFLLEDYISCAQGCGNNCWKAWHTLNAQTYACIPQNVRLTSFQQTNTWISRLVGVILTMCGNAFCSSSWSACVNCLTNKLMVWLGLKALFEQT